MFSEKGVSVVQCRERHGIKGDILAQLCHMFAVAIFLSPLSNRSHQFVSSLFVGTALSHQTFCKKKEFVLLKILTSSLFAMHHANYELDQIKISSKAKAWFALCVSAVKQAPEAGGCIRADLLRSVEKWEVLKRF